MAAFNPLSFSLVVLLSPTSPHQQHETHPTGLREDMALSALEGGGGGQRDGAEREKKQREREGLFEEASERK